MDHTSFSLGACRGLRQEEVKAETMRGHIFPSGVGEGGSVKVL